MNNKITIIIGSLIVLLFLYIFYSISSFAVGDCKHILTGYTIQGIPVRTCADELVKELKNGK
jgi:hypothetical protein